MGNDLITLDQIIEGVRTHGYELTKRTFQYYVQSGLLPKGKRKGYKKGGVQFYYPSSTIIRIMRIFELKAEGNSLSAIRERLSFGPAALPIDEMVAFSHHGKGEVSEAGSVSHFSGKRGFELLNAVMSQTPGGAALKSCLQCGTCGGSCPSAADMTHTPRQLFSMLLAGLGQEVLSSNTPWFCVSCYYCTVRCPQKIPITEIMYTLKQLAVKEGRIKITDAYDFSKTFVNLVKKYGRSFDFGLALRYHLTHNTVSKVSWGSLALRMYKKERMVTGPSRIKEIDKLSDILEKAKKIGDDK
jgi:heterodisulfide reductase subunit C/DNA-binding transcriptional MerR regulator